jgi:hypothetical protein
MCLAIRAILVHSVFFLVCLGCTKNMGIFRVTNMLHFNWYPHTDLIFLCICSKPLISVSQPVITCNTEKKAEDRSRL